MSTIANANTNANTNANADMITLYFIRDIVGFNSVVADDPDDDSYRVYSNHDDIYDIKTPFAASAFLESVEDTSSWDGYDRDSYTIDDFIYGLGGFDPSDQDFYRYAPTILATYTTIL